MISRKFSLHASLTFLFLFSAFSLTSTLVCAQKKPIEIVQLTDHVYLHISYLKLGDQYFGCNGLYVVTDEGIIILDTPTDEEQTLQLLDSISSRHNKKVVSCIVSHYHIDCNAGLDILKDRHISTWSTVKTDQLAAEKNEKRAGNLFSNDTTFHFGNQAIETFYPGEGHTSDNIVFWLPKEKILFGGCFVKSIEAKGLGNTADANLQKWPDSIQKVIDKFSNATIVVPGHQQWSDKQNLYHTLDLLKTHQ